MGPAYAGPYFWGLICVGKNTGRPKNNKGVRIDIQPRFKIQYPMKNQDKDNRNDPILQYLGLKFI